MKGGDSGAAKAKGGKGEKAAAPKVKYDPTRLLREEKMRNTYASRRAPALFSTGRYRARLAQLAPWCRRSCLELACGGRACRISKELPKLNEKLRKMLSEWEAAHAEPFLYEGNSPLGILGM